MRRRAFFWLYEVFFAAAACRKYAGNGGLSGEPTAQGFFPCPAIFMYPPSGLRQTVGQAVGGLRADKGQARGNNGKKIRKKRKIRKNIYIYQSVEKFLGISIADLQAPSPYTRPLAERFFNNPIYLI